MAMTSTQTGGRRWSLPNILTYARIAAIPVVVGCIYAQSIMGGPLALRWVALAVFIAAAITDFLDGYYARIWDQQSAFGRMLDPIADKLLVASCLLMLAADSIIHGWTLWAAIVILCREILVSGLREYLAELKVRLPVSAIAKWKTVAQLVALGFFIAGPAGEAVFPETIRVGVTAGPHAEIIDVVKKVAAERGLDLKPVEFTDYVVPNQALAQKDLEANSFQHEPYLKNQIAKTNWKIVKIGNTIASPQGVYSIKYKTLAELPQGATVAIANDPSNGARGLLILALHGVIKLRDGVGVAASVADLHSANNKLNKENSLSEKAAVINGRGDTPNRHDILTGSQPDGTAFAGSDDRTCKNWTSSLQGAAMVGHSDINGPATVPTAKSWNAAHPSRGPDGGCSQNDLKSTGGEGLLYCFAVN